MRPDGTRFMNEIFFDKKVEVQTKIVKDKLAWGLERLLKGEKLQNLLPSL